MEHTQKEKSEIKKKILDRASGQCECTHFAHSHLADGRCPNKVPAELIEKPYIGWKSQTLKEADIFHTTSLIVICNQCLKQKHFFC